MKKREKGYPIFSSLSLHNVSLAEKHFLFSPEFDVDHNSWVELQRACL